MFTNFDCDAFFVADRAALISALSVLPEYLYLTHTRVGGRMALRMSISGTLTERRHVERAWAIIREAADGTMRN